MCSSTQSALCLPQQPSLFLKSTCWFSGEFVGQWTNKASACQPGCVWPASLRRLNFTDFGGRSVRRSAEEVEPSLQFSPRVEAQTWSWSLRSRTTSNRTSRGSLIWAENSFWSEFSSCSETPSGGRVHYIMIINLFLEHVDKLRSQDQNQVWTLKYFLTNVTSNAFSYPACGITPFGHDPLCRIHERSFSRHRLEAQA